MLSIDLSGQVESKAFVLKKTFFKYSPWFMVMITVSIVINRVSAICDQSVLHAQ